MEYLIEAADLAVVALVAGIVFTCGLIVGLLIGYHKGTQRQLDINRRKHERVRRRKATDSESAARYETFVRNSVVG